MALYLVGENIDAQTAFRRSRNGELAQVVRGIYLDAVGDIDATLRAHAVRTLLSRKHGRRRPTGPDRYFRP